MKASGVINAGGKSSRMKFNKAFAQIDGIPIIKIIIDKFIPLFSEIIIISNEPELYEKLGYRVYADIYPGKGPVGGMHAALSYAAHEHIFILGCDMPFMDMRIAEYMLDKLGDRDSVVPRIKGYMQPMSAVYSKKCLPRLKYNLETDRLKLTRLFEELDALIIEEEELAYFGNLDELFLNVNDQDTLQKAVDIARRVQLLE
ncbi:MAG TPA: molybdenum cofactor guanylyltransferase [Syntrophomonadaceae bacterium]|nr:molybdenum cofactor guanylyltransferase [Syntrophomonadaceae bacterium]HPR94021.1 molybdenum cofactor guanylyltransferase [Syntrophomonadaceae bacterium]